MHSDKPKYHQLNQCALYKVPNPKRLAKLLFQSEVGIEALGDTKDRYKCWNAEKKSGGTRSIEAPHDNLKAVQKRIADLLQKIEPPAYLMAPVKGRSYVDNAAVHRGAKAFSLLDIEDFFPSCTDKKVYWFFNKVLHCPPDVAALLTKLTTYNGHLPQGSPCSPILAYFAYKEMWDEINGISQRAKCKLSIYADDITISGETVYGRDIWAIKQSLHKHGHRYSVKKERQIVNKPADITGVIVAGEELLLPNRQHKKIAETMKELDAARSGEEREYAGRKLRGRMAQAGQILSH